jgi:hypothetical protein
MVGYQHAQDMLRDLGGDCLWEGDCSGTACTALSIWRLGGREVVLKCGPDGQLRLFDELAAYPSGRPDGILDALAHLMGGAGGTALTVASRPHLHRGCGHDAR